ncbi:MAG: hypothetical protein KF846_19170 [Cyclobacteriaceae bacterium]|nr:hypothetical protein [Cyclobacteriaceae bacterium]
MEAVQTHHITWIILLGTLGMLLLVGFMGLFILLYQKRMLKEREMRAARELEYQSQMIQLQLESQEQERKRIGADLHDSLGSLLWGPKSTHRSCINPETSTMKRWNPTKNL